jgi:hypothetical protein
MAGLVFFLHLRNVLGRLYFIERGSVACSPDVACSEFKGAAHSLRNVFRLSKKVCGIQAVSCILPFVGFGKKTGDRI